MNQRINPFLNLNYKSVIEDLGDDYYDIVSAAEFPAHFLRFRNDALLPTIGLDPTKVQDNDFVSAFGKFEGVKPFLALRYHGYQFGAYNPFLGDGRGFLYGQVHDQNNCLYDLGSKGSGRTPYSRNADGRLTLKGGVREALAAEALHQLGVNTSRCLSLIETGESLWRGDEPSPTRSSVMIRVSQSHIRFGTLERLHHLKRPDLLKKLLDSVIATYYPIIPDTADKYVQFYEELVRRVAKLTAQWMAAGFCHGVLNTDNMSITGESFDYGPYAFIPNYNPRFTAASFDYGGRYRYGNQPYICKFNLELLQRPLSLLTGQSSLEAQLNQFDDCYQKHYQHLMLQKLGLANAAKNLSSELLTSTLHLLEDSQIGYHNFFRELTIGFSPSWQSNYQLILENANFNSLINNSWRQMYHKNLSQLSTEELHKVEQQLQQYNPPTALLRPLIESVWQAISEVNDWQPFHELMIQLQQNWQSSQ